MTRALFGPAGIGSSGPSKRGPPGSDSSGPSKQEFVAPKVEISPPQVFKWHSVETLQRLIICKHSSNKSSEHQIKGTGLGTPSKYLIFQATISPDEDWSNNGASLRAVNKYAYTTRTATAAEAGLEGGQQGPQQGPMGFGKEEEDEDDTIAPSCSDGPFTNDIVVLIEPDAGETGTIKHIRIAACLVDGSDVEHTSEEFEMYVVFGAPPSVKVTLMLTTDAATLTTSVLEALRLTVGRTAFRKEVLTPAQDAQVIFNASHVVSANLSATSSGRRLLETGFSHSIPVTVVAETNQQAVVFQSVVETNLASSLASALQTENVSVQTIQLDASIVPSSSLATGGRFASCDTHYDCRSEHFCSAKRECMDCHFCLVDARDSVTGTCPQDLCPGSGGMPECIDGQKFLSQGSECKAVFSFQVWRFNSSIEGAPQVTLTFPSTVKAQMQSNPVLFLCCTLPNVDTFLMLTHTHEYTRTGRAAI